MEITWDNLFDRIREQPPDHLGGYSPKFLWNYFFGYSQALAVHNAPQIEGSFGLYDFNRWFISNAYSGPQGFGSYCELLTNTDNQALDLFFEFRRIAKAGEWKEENPLERPATDGSTTFLELIRSEALQKRPAMYFGNGERVTGLWVMWNGYVWAEKDLGVKDSPDIKVFEDFQKWLDERFPFAQGANFGKIFQFLALDVSDKAFENFFDHLELFLAGGAADANTKRFQTFLDDAVASALKHRAENDKSN
jgi:hypothetical protein